MSVVLELVLDRARALAGEDVGFRLSVRNDSGADVVVRDPAVDDEWPRIEVLDANGWRVAYAARNDRMWAHADGPRIPLPPVQITLAPRAKAQASEWLARRVGLLPPRRDWLRARPEARGTA